MPARLMVDSPVPGEMPGESTVRWAQDTFYRSQVISEAEVAWKVLQDAYENGRRNQPSEALEEAQEALKVLVPPTSALMERSGWGGDRHHALVRYAYRRASKQWRIRKVWVDLELPAIPEERKRPPASPKMTFTPWGRLPRPDVFLEATAPEAPDEEKKVWIECQTAIAWRGLSDKARAARLFGEQNEYDVFVVVGVSPDDRFLAEVQQAVEAVGKKFEHWDPKKQPLPEIGEDATKLIQQEVTPPPPSLGPLVGVDRFWEWRRGSNRSPAVIVEDVPLMVPASSAGRIEVATVSWPGSCSDCAGTGSSPGDVREICSRCEGNGLVSVGGNNWKLCPRCRAAQTLPTDPCERCQGQGWLMSGTTVGTTMVIPSPGDPTDWRERVVNLYPDKSSEGGVIRSRKLVLRIHISFEDAAQVAGSSAVS